MPDLDPLFAPTALSLTADDGFTLGAQRYAPRGPRRASLVILGATAVPQRIYDRYARWLAARGVEVLTFDYRGVGRSHPGKLRGFEATMSDWALLDARAALRWQRSQEGPRLVLGHSFGGQIIGLLDELNEVDGMMLVGSQIGALQNWPRRSWPWLGLFFYGLVPAGTALAGYLPGALGLKTDLPAGVAREWGKWCRHPDYLAGHHPGAAERYARFDRPTLFYSFTDDSFAPRSPVDALLDRIGRAPLRHRRVSPREAGRPVGHFGYFRPEHAATLWPESLAFFDAIIDRRPLDFAPAASRPRRDLGLRLQDVLDDLPAAPHRAA